MAYCRNCGSELGEKTKFCQNCGASVLEEGANNIAFETVNASENTPVGQKVVDSSENKKNKKKGRFIGVLLLALSIVDFYSDPAILTIVLSIALFIGCVYCLKKKYKGKVFTIIALIITVICLYAGFTQAREIGLLAVPSDEKVAEQVAVPSANKTTTSVESATSKVEIEKKPTTRNEEKKETFSGVDPELKAFLDSYEAFMGEYVEFMKKYSNNPSDALAMLSEYTKFMEKYAEFAEAVEKYDSEDMSPEDAKYYLEVINRCNMKMLEVY